MAKSKEDNNVVARFGEKAQPSQATAREAKAEDRQSAIGDMIKKNIEAEAENNPTLIDNILEGVTVDIVENKKVTPKKERANIYIDKEYMDKLKTLAIKSNKSIIKVTEEILVKILKNVETDTELVKMYDEKNKAMGRGRRSDEAKKAEKKAEREKRKAEKEQKKENQNHK